MAMQMKPTLLKLDNFPSYRTITQPRIELGDCDTVFPSAVIGWDRVRVLAKCAVSQITTFPRELILECVKVFVVLESAAVLQVC